jgi:hypothetical protein
MERSLMSSWNAGKWQPLVWIGVLTKQVVIMVGFSSVLSLTDVPIYWRSCFET